MKVIDEKEVIELLCKQGVVAMRSDTVYGLFARADSDIAIQRIFAIKGRVANKGLPVLVADIASINTIAHVSADQLPILSAIWPAPLTVIIPAKFGILSLAVTGGHNSVAVRCPDSAILREIIRAIGIPLVATSANLSGNPECRSAGAVLREFANAQSIPDGIFDSGEVSEDVLPSTIIDLTSSKPRLVRKGAWMGDLSLFSKL